MGTQAPLDLETLYGPISEDMARLTRFLASEFPSDEPFLGDLIAHVERFRGKQLRPALLFLSSRLEGGSTAENHVKMAAVVELIHTATLVHDDLLDDAMLRRRVETVHQRWGDRAAVLIGDYIYSRAFYISTQVPGMASIMSEATNTICEGELLQVGDRFRIIDEPRYLEIIEKKTAVLYGVSCQIGGVLAGLSPGKCRSLRQFGMDLGRAFQIVDDCLDYIGEERVAGKSLGSDLRQGKITLPLIHLLEGVGEVERATFRDLLEAPLSTEQQAWIRARVIEEGAAETALERAGEFVEAARTRLAEAFDPKGPPPVWERLDLLAEYILRRRR